MRRIAESLTLDGADRLARTITAYWRRQGRDRGLRVFLVPVKVRPGLPQIWTVRSNLANGEPPPA